MNYTVKVNCISVTLTLISISDYVVTPCIMCVQYIGGIFNTLGDTMSTSGDIMMHVGDTMSTSGDVQHIGEVS